MGQYKIPQNVEAEDKILGPFTFRQFVYLLIAAGGGFVAWILFNIAWPLVLIPVPFIILALALALPLRKDQPMETYLLALTRYFLLPKKRIWKSYQADPHVIIRAKKDDEKPLTKDIRGEEASERLSFLAQVLDTGGWSTLGVSEDITQVNSNINKDVAQQFINEAEKKDDFNDNSHINQEMSIRLSNEENSDTNVLNSNNYDNIYIDNELK